MRVVLTNHAVGRFHERVKSHLTHAQAKAELIALTEMADTLCEDCPLETDATEIEDAHAGYLEVAPGIWLALVKRDDGLTAITCLTHSAFSEQTRRRRNAEKRRARSAKRFRKYRNGRRIEDGVW